MVTDNEKETTGSDNTGTNANVDRPDMNSPGREDPVVASPLNSFEVALPDSKPQQSPANASPTSEVASTELTPDCDQGDIASKDEDEQASAANDLRESLGSAKSLR